MYSWIPYHYQFRIILIGDPGVGKSALMGQFTGSRFEETIMPTVGVDFSSKMIQIEDKKIKLQIWDTAGHEKFRTITKSYYRDAAGALLVYDITNRETLENISYWHEDIINGAGPNKIVELLVGHKIDMKDERVVSKYEAEQIADTYSQSYVETSAKYPASVEAAFTKLATLILNSILQGRIKIVEGWDGVRINKSDDKKQSFPELESRTNNRILLQSTDKQSKCSC